MPGASLPAKKIPPVGKRMMFKAQLENWAEGMDYCAVAVPERVTKAMGTTGPVLVMAQVDKSAPFKVSLFPVGEGRHYIRIKAQVRRETNTRTGDTVTLRFTVLDRADVLIPQDLTDALREHGLEEAFKALSPGKQNYAIRLIDQAVKAETRSKRVQQAVSLAQQNREPRK